MGRPVQPSGGIGQFLGMLLLFFTILSSSIGKNNVRNPSRSTTRRTFGKHATAEPFLRVYLYGDSHRTEQN